MYSNTQKTISFKNDRFKNEMNIPIKKILCATDFSDASNNAVECAARFAKRLGASLTLWNMHELPLLESIAEKFGLPNSVQTKQEELTQVLQEWCDEISKEFNIVCGYSLERNSGSLERTLEHYINGEHYDLIVTGTNGTDSLYKYYFGTDSFRIIQRVKCPVLVIPGSCDCSGIAQILYGTDYDETDISWATQLSDMFDGELSIAHVSKEDSEKSKTKHQEFKDKLEKANLKNHIEIERRISTDVASGFREIVFDLKPDLLVLSRKERNFIEEALHKSFTEEVLNDLAIPLFVIHS